MAYTQTYGRSPRGKAGSLALVALIHVGLAGALVTGLTVDGIIPVESPPLVAGQLPIDPPAPTPEPTPEPRTDPIEKASVVTAPTPPVVLVHSPVPLPPPTFDDIPVTPIPQPSPLVLPSPTPSASPAPAFDPVPARPRNAASSWVTNDDYPRRDLIAGHQGTTRFRVVIGTDGRVSACEILASSGHAGLDKAACDRITRRARFEPARDGNGDKVVGTYTNSIRWRIPD